MRRWFVLLTAALVAIAGFIAAPASAAPSPIGRLGDTLQVQFEGLVADITVHSVDPSPVPPGFGYPPRPPRNEVWRAWITVHPIKVPTPYAQAITYQFRGVTATGDAYEPRNTDAPDALQYALNNAPAGSTVSGAVFWDCYRDLVSNVVLIDKISGEHLAQWNVS
jgi:endonuclease YncB( thermonuclease family)